MPLEEPRPAFETIQASLSRFAAALGTADPVDWLGEPLRLTFQRPRYDPVYGSNKLAPGALPIELSFSETSPDSLRLDLELFDAHTPPLERFRRTVAATHSLASRCFGPEAGRCFEEAALDYPLCRSDSWVFGAFFGASFGREGPEAFKIYADLGSKTPVKLPSRLKARAHQLIEAVPQAAPLFLRIAARRKAASQRLYFINRADQPLLKLAPLVESLAPAGSFPRLLASLLPLASGSLILPPGALVCSLGDEAEGPDLKIELMPQRIPGRLAAFPISSLFAGRPQSLAAFQRWERSLPAGPVRWTAAGARLDPSGRPALNFYAAPWLCR